MEAGEVAFLKHTTVSEMIQSKSFKSTSPDQFQLLCKNGQRAPVSDYLQCNWGLVPSNAIVTSSARRIEERKQYQNFLEKAQKMYSRKSSSNSTFSSGLNGNNRFNDQFQTDRFGNRIDPNDRRNIDRNFNSRDPFGTSSTTENPLNDSQVYENFDIFESGRYGSRLNLMFQVILPLRFSGNYLLQILFKGFNLWSKTDRRNRANLQSIPWRTRKDHL